MSTKSIEHRMRKGIPLTKPQKLRVLKDARALLETNWTKSTWVDMIDGVEHYCLYGAVEKVGGLDPEREEEVDELVSSCSLTTTMFEGLPKTNKRRLYAEREIERLIDHFAGRIEAARESGNKSDVVYYEEMLLLEVMSAKVTALQAVNDTQGHKAVLRVLDRAIENLEGPS